MGDETRDGRAADRGCGGRAPDRRERRAWRVRHREAPATQITARLLEKWIEPGGYVADIGVGSGILTIAALRLGAARVFALDVDEASIARARQNVANNDVSDRAVLAHREVDPVTDGPFDLVIANILPTVLLHLAPTFPQLVRPGGVLLLGGVVRRRMDEVATTIEGQGFRALEERSKWHLGGSSSAAGVTGGDRRPTRLPCHSPSGSCEA